tara:strand:+ start:40 stop:609 length:570 start_codon:yes stop_codon:yes gene_type:complete
MSERVLFISGRCPHSKKILLGISQYEFLKPLFKVINIDTQAYPNYIKSIPSLLINGQIITGGTVFEYLGKLVEGKKEQEERASENTLKESDQGQCSINQDGELEGWCGGGSDIGFSAITEDNDDYTKKTYKIDSNLSFLEGMSEASLQGQVQQMENQDNNLGQKKQQFDNDYERLQKERGEVGNGMARK